MVSVERWAQRSICCVIIGAGELVLHSPAHAQSELITFTDWGRVESISSAWRDDGMGVHHSAPFLNSRKRVVNPVTSTSTIVDECKTVNDGYATDPSDPGHKLHHAMIIGAFLHNKQVRLLLQGCAYDKPRIISVEVRD